MKNLFIISESEKQRILGMHVNATKKQYLKEDLTAQEPVTSNGEGFKVYFPEDGYKLDKDATELVVNNTKNQLKKSISTIEKFVDSTDFKLPKFIEIGSSTSSTGSREVNALKGEQRIQTMIKCLYKAFDKLGEETGQVVGADYIQSFIKTNTDYTYKPTGLKKLYDAAKSEPNPEERFAYIIIKKLSTMGHTESGIDDIEDILKIARGHNINPDEDGIAKGICRLETYSDITDLDNELRDFGGLEYFINTSITNGFTTWGSDSKERREIMSCLNRASNRSGKGDIADIAGDKLTIIGM